MLKNNTNFKPLIISLDDDVDFNALLTKVLTKLDVETLTFTTVEPFKKMVENKKPALVIVDLNLGDKFGEGLKVIADLRQKIGDELPILVLTKRAGKEDVSAAFELGASDYLTKPLDDILLLAKIRQFIKISQGKVVQAKEETGGLSYKQIPSHQQDAYFHLGMRIQEINEFGIKITGQHFFSRGTPIKIKSPLLYDLFGEDRHYSFIVHQNWLENETGKAGAFLEFDASNEDLMAKVRTWLLQRGKSELVKLNSTAPAASSAGQTQANNAKPVTKPKA